MTPREEVPEVGYYINLFEVSISPTKTNFMVAERRLYPSLRELREEVKASNRDLGLYASGDKIFGYGRDLDYLSDKGFTKVEVELYEEPKLTGRLILEGAILKAREFGYETLEEKKGRVVLFSKEYNETSDGNVRVYTGYDIRSIYLLEPFSKRLRFYLVIDLSFLLRDKNNNPLNYRQIKQLYGTSTLKETRALQRDMIQVGEGVYKANLDASRYRLVECIIPFAKRLNSFKLPCEVDAQVSPKPVRIVEVI